MPRSIKKGPFVDHQGEWSQADQNLVASLHGHAGICRFDYRRS